MTRTLAFPPRADRLARLESAPFDVLVVGGGVTGAATARDAASRGLSVALAERDDWASGTSSRSSKLVHGGLRYLRQGDVRLVFESLSERARLQRLCPHLVRPLDFLFPTYSGRGAPAWLLELGLSAYDLLACGTAPRRHRRLSRLELLALEPLLQDPALVSGALGFDCRTDDARLTLENVLDAAAMGAVAVSRLELVRLDPRSKDGPLGARLRDRETDRVHEVRASVIVNATGPWTDRVRVLDEPGAPPKLRLSRGAHVSLPAARLPLESAVAFPLEDRRLLFAIPFGPVTLLGTTETEHMGSPDEIIPSAREIEYLLAAARETFPTARLGPSDVVGAFAALRPLVAAPGKTLGTTSREESIEWSPSGVLTVTGGKLTTHRRMGARAIDAAAARLAARGRAVGPSATGDRLFPGAPAEPLSVFLAAIARDAEALGISPESARHLALRYGRRAEGVLALVAEDRSSAEPLAKGLPDIAAEVAFAARCEDARSIEDALMRRTHLFWQAPTQGLEALERTGSILARELGWTSEQSKVSADSYAREVERSRAWRGEPLPAR